MSDALSGSPTDSALKILAVDDTRSVTLSMGFVFAKPQYEFSYVESGLDALALIAAAVWVVVTMRLAIPRWLRGLAASACFFALVVTAVAMAIG